MDRLTSEKLRPDLLKAMDKRHSYFFRKGATARVILTKDPYSERLGKTFDEIARENNESFSETVIRLLVENELEVGFAGVDNHTEAMREKLYEDQYHLFSWMTGIPLEAIRFLQVFCAIQEDLGLFQK